MPQTARRYDETPIRFVAKPAAQVTAVAIESAPFVAGSSPARQLHERLVATFQSPADMRDPRWPLHARVAAIVAGAALCWIATGGIVYAII